MLFKSKNNPFSTKPNTKLIGLEDKKTALKNYTEGGDICFLNGPAGTGKSSVLKWMQSNLKGHKILYLDGKELDEYFDLNKYLLQKRNFLQKLFRIKPKNVTLLVDEAQDCLKSFIDALQTSWDNDKVKSVIITQISSDLSAFPYSFRERIGKKIVRLRRLNEDEISELINLRTKGKHPFDEEAVSIIAEKADYIPRRALEICKIAYNEINKKKITAEDIENLLNKIEEELLLSEPVKLEKLEGRPQNDAIFPLENVDGAEKLSPMQKKIVKLLLEDRRTTKQLAKILNTSEGSIGKQLSELIRLNVIGVLNERRPKLYGVLQSFKDSLEQKQ